MNTGEELCKLQNSSRVIELLAAQRQLHSDVKAVYIAHGVISIGIPISVALFPNVSALSLVLSVIVPVVLGRALVDWAESRQAEAASVQQMIDAILFGLELPHVAYNRSLAARRSKSHIEKHGKETLENWYPKRICSLAAGEAEYECQGVSIIWTRDLSVLAMLLDSIIVTAAIILAVLGIRESGSSSVAYVLLTPIIDWFLEALLDRCRLYKAIKRIKSSREDLGDGQEESLFKVQELIYSYRCLRPVPDFLYRLSRDIEQEKAELRL